MADVAKSVKVKIGDFLFKYRNWLFPVAIGTAFLTRRPPSEYFGDGGLVAMKNVMAFAFAAGGLGVRAAVIGYAYIKRGGLQKKVYADKLVTEGFFGVCRNPLYVGNVLIYAGVFLYHGDPYVALCGTALTLAAYTCIIAAEEFFLRDKFGAAYDAYCADVPRWIPDFSKLAVATEGMRFNWRRVLVKDYTTVANTFITMAVIHLLARLDAGGLTGGNWPAGGPWLRDAAVIVLLLLFTLTVAVFKKTGKLKEKKEAA